MTELRPANRRARVMGDYANTTPRPPQPTRRVCKTPGCDTILSRYERWSEPYCYQCQDRQDPYRRLSPDALHPDTYAPSRARDSVPRNQR